MIMYKVKQFWSSIYSLVVILVIIGIVSCDDYVHNPIQYQSRSDKGAYNFGYDTGLSGAHQFHQESKDESGTVRGRYGYTDPDGKLRLTYYSSGVNGYQVWGPDSTSPPPPPPPPPASSQFEAESGQSIAYVTKSVDQPSKASYNQVVDSTSKVSSRIAYPQSPAARIVAIKSAKIVATPIIPPSKSVQRQEYATKNFFSPAETFRARYTETTKTSEPTKTQQVQQVQHTKGGVTSQIVLEQSVKSASIKTANRPVPITPVQYRANYPPAGKYSRCYCE